MINENSDRTNKVQVKELSLFELERLHAQLESQESYMLEVQAQLEESERLLKKQNSQLEDTVTQRTRELQTAINELENEIQEKIQVQERLEQTHEELNTLFYRSSHDFRAPICSSRGLINLLRGEIESTTCFHYLDLLEDSLNKLDALTRTLTTIAEVRQGEISQSHVCISELLDALVRTYRYQYPKHRVILDTGAQMYSPTDREIFEHVVRKLLDNAFFYSSLQVGSESQPLVKISLQDVGGQIMLEICDNGPGISEDVRPYVFDMFYRGHSASKGNGLGLYLAKLAVNQLGGNLELSNCDDGGLCVKIALTV